MTSSVPPDHKPEVKHFEFPEKQDYVPVYLSLNNVVMDNLKEIGLYIESACKGAVVVTDTLVQISAYLDAEDLLTPDNTEFVFYYESKSQPQERRTVRLNQSMLTKSFIDNNPAYPYYQIKLSDSDIVVPGCYVTSLNQNYPNPFNPSTTIAYNLKDATTVSLNIYNIKGQLVKSLVNEEQKTGNHSVVWNGKDDPGKTCASGVYFSRLDAGKSVLTRKMVLLK